MMSADDHVTSALFPTSSAAYMPSTHANSCPPCQSDIPRALAGTYSTRQVVQTPTTDRVNYFGLDGQGQDAFVSSLSTKYKPPTPTIESLSSSPGRNGVYLSKWRSHEKTLRGSCAR